MILGYPQGVCFRATCPGIWGLIHTRVDQASFRRRFFTYRHYSFKGTWDLKDQGVIEAGAVPVRELFLVLPEDVIEFKLSDRTVTPRWRSESLDISKRVICRNSRSGWRIIHTSRKPVRTMRSLRLIEECLRIVPQGIVGWIRRASQQSADYFRWDVSLACLSVQAGNTGRTRE